jgi:hypothetical protein
VPPSLADSFTKTHALQTRTARESALRPAFGSSESAA